MVVEINSATDQLQLKHPETGKWTPGVTLLQLAGGFDVTLISEQMDSINTILLNTASIKQLVNTSTEIKAALENTFNIIQSLSQNSNASTVNSIFSTAESINDKIAALLESVDASATSTENLEMKITTLNNAIQSIQEQIGTLADHVKSIRDGRTTSVQEQTVNVDVANVTKSIGLPSTTEALEFLARPDANENYFDVRYSFVQGNLEKGIYRTLLAGNEFQKTNLAFKNQQLFLQCSNFVTIELMVYYTP